MELASRISGDWIELKNASRDPEQLEELLGLSSHAPMARELAGSVEGGVVEAKQRRLTKLFEILEDIKYNSRSMGQLESQAGSIASLIYAILAERGVVEGTIRLPSERQDSTPDQMEKVKQQEIRDIIEDVQAIVATDPSAKMAAAIKNILLQVSKYRSELENLKRLSQGATEEKKKAYAANFQKSFSDIFASIRKNYAEYLRQQAQEAHAAERGFLEGLDTKPLVRHLSAEAEALSAFRSTILYVRREQVRVLENVARLADRKEELLTMMDRELELFAEIQAKAGRPVRDGGVAFSKRLGQELSQYLNERTRLLTPESERREEKAEQPEGPTTA